MSNNMPVANKNEVQFLVAIDRIQTKQLPYSKLLQKNSNYKKENSQFLIYLNVTWLNKNSSHRCHQNVTINPVIVLGSFKPHNGWTLANQGLHSVVTFLQFIYKIYNEK